VQTFVELDAIDRADDLPVFGWPIFDQTRPPSVEMRRQMDMSQQSASTHDRPQPILDIAARLSRLSLPSASLVGTSILFTNDFVGQTIVFNTDYITTPGAALRNQTWVNENLLGIRTWLDAVGTYGSPMEVNGGQRPAWRYTPTFVVRSVAHSSLTRDAKVEKRQPEASWAAPWTNRIVSAIHDLKAWLDLTTDEVADLIGASTGAVYYWQRVDTEPRAGLARRITRIHSLLKGLRRSTTPVGFNAILRAKPQGIDTSAYDHLLSHDFDGAEALLHRYVFAGSRREPKPFWAVRSVDWPDDVPKEASPSVTLKSPRTRRSRVKLRPSD
jgi:hypothetical protein